VVSQEALAYCQARVRADDRDRFLASLFAPSDRRTALWALYAFDDELKRVRERVTQPLAGELRLHWWREVIEGTREHGGHPVATAITDVASHYALPTRTVVGLIDARQFDLYDEPMQTRSDLQAYAHRTSSAVITLAQCILNGVHPSDASRAEIGGFADSIVRVLLALPTHTVHAQRFLPQDLLDRHSVARSSILNRTPTAGLTAALGELRNDVRRDLASLRANLGEMPSRLAPAILPLASLPIYLDQLDAHRDNPFAVRAEVSAWRRQWRLWRAARDPRRIIPS
jgi:15-cis-phytoene synthase